MNTPRITKEELKEKLDRGERLVILDIRNSIDYGLSDKKLPGAQRVPLGDIEKAAGKLDRAVEVVTYCT